MSDRGKRSSPKIAYVLDEFPSLSELFILREMQGLRERHGLQLLPVALRRGQQEAAYSAAAREMLPDAVFRPARRWGLWLLPPLLLLRWPAGYASALGIVVRQGLRRPGLLRELGSALLAAGYFALRLPRSLRHVHGNWASHPATVALLLAEIRGVGFSFSAHARDLFTDEAHFMDLKLPEAEFVTVCTAYGRDTLLHRHPLASAGKVFLVYHGVDLHQYAPIPLQHRQPPLILSVGRLVEKKGYPILLRAAGILRSRGGEFRLAIIGEGPERQDLMSLATGLGLTDVVEFRGAQNAEEVRRAYAEADVFALASVVASDQDRDGLPNVLLEALACGLPTVATQVSAIPELIVPEETGLLAKPGDAEDLAEKLERMLFDDELRAVVAQLGRERVAQHFRLERSVARMAELLEGAL
jgi:glycosyltransferase involved in cell wall biosynthesis